MGFLFLQDLVQAEPHSFQAIPPEQSAFTASWVGEVATDLDVSDFEEPSDKRASLLFNLLWKPDQLL